MELLGEKCAVFGVYGTGLEVARLSFFGLFALQHRGQESAGIAVADGESITLHKGMGLVSQVFTEDNIKQLQGHISVAHNRYSTAGGSHVKHAQPMLVAGKGSVERPAEAPSAGMYPYVSLQSAPEDDSIALVHNGNLPSTKALADFLASKKIDSSEYSDSRMVAEAIGALMREGKGLEDAIAEVYPLMTGAFSILIMSKDRLIAIRDTCGIRPLSVARLNGGYVIASETCAYPTIGAEFLREIEPGEMLVIDEKGMRTRMLGTPNPKLDIFEFVYFARPDSEILGKSVYEVRKNFGVQLARENKIEADVVIPVPETAIPSAVGFSRTSGIPMELGLAKNRYIHRTFIQPEQHIRDQGVKSKLTPIIDCIKGKRVVVIDDSIVRGTTSRQIVQMLFDAGATEVHFLVASPPVKFPDFYGIDTPDQSDLIASTKSVEEIREHLKATSLRYLSYEGMIAATGLSESQFCTSCFNGVYPIDIKERAQEITFK